MRNQKILMQYIITILNIDELERLTFLDKSKNCLDSNNNKIKDTESICNI